MSAGIIFIYPISNACQWYLMFIIPSAKSFFKVTTWIISIQLTICKGGSFVCEYSVTLKCYCTIRAMPIFSYAYRQFYILLLSIHSYCRIQANYSHCHTSFADNDKFYVQNQYNADCRPKNHVAKSVMLSNQL